MITKIRIRSIDNYLIGIPNNEAFYIGVEIGEIGQDRLKKSDYQKNFVKVKCFYLPL